MKKIHDGLGESCDTFLLVSKYLVLLKCLKFAIDQESANTDTFLFIEKILLILMAFFSVTTLYR